MLFSVPGIYTFKKKNPLQKYKARVQKSLWCLHF